MDKLHILTITLTPSSNPTIWTDNDLSKLIHGEVVVGYLLKSVKIDSERCSILNVYVIRPECLSSTHKIILLRYFITPIYNG